MDTGDLPSRSATLAQASPSPASTLTRRLRICIASPDVNGPIRNGGIGTASSALAEFLADQGHEVTLLYSLGRYAEQGSIGHWVETYRRRGVLLAPCPPPSVPVEAPLAAQRAYAVYLWLRERPFDIVYFPEWSACGYYAIQAKRQGLAFASTTLAVITHSPTLWHHQGNQQLVVDRYTVLLDDMERACVAHADVVVSPSRYMLDWMATNGWSVPAARHVMPNLSPRHAVAAAPAESAPPEEIVFFGRLEPRKGIRLFRAAIDRIAPALKRRKIQVTFLGKPSQDDTFDSLAFIAEAKAAWGLRVEVISDYGARAAVDYLASPGRMAVIASLIDNSPYTVQECLGRGVPFLAARVGGVPEMIDPASSDVLFEPTPPALAQTLLRAVEQGLKPALPSVTDGDLQVGWLDFQQRIAPHAAPAPKVSPRPAASGPAATVCLIHHNRPQMLHQAVAGLEAQTHADFEVVLVDDGSRPEALDAVDALLPRFQARGWKILKQTNRYLGAARNRAVAEARAPWILFHDDDNIARPHMLATMLGAAQAADADIVTSAMGVFQGEAPAPQDEPAAIWAPLGALPAFGAIENVFGDANALVRRSTFEAMGGFTEDFGVGHEDWEFFARAVLAGHTLVSVPEALFHYRVSAVSMLRSGHDRANLARSLRPYLETAPAHLRSPLMLMQGLAMDSAAQELSREAFDQQRRKLEATLAEVSALVSTGDSAGGALKARLAALQDMVGEGAGGLASGDQLSDIARAIYDDPLMRLTRPLRNWRGRRRGAAPEPDVLPPMTESQKIDFIVEATRSASWEATGPLRLALRLLRRRR